MTVEVIFACLGLSDGTLCNRVVAGSGAELWLVAVLLCVVAGVVGEWRKCCRKKVVQSGRSGVVG